MRGLMDQSDDVNMPDLGDDNGDEIGDEIAANIGTTVDNDDVVQIGTEEEVIAGEIGADIGATLDNEDVVQKYIEEEVIAKQKTLDKGKGVMSSDKGEGVRKKRMSRPRGNGISIRENEDPSCGSNSDSESETHHQNQMYMSDDSESKESLKSFDYLSEGEAEVIELRKRMTQFRSGGAEGEEEVEGSDNDQNDSFDDEGFVTPKRMFDMGISDTVKEHEQDMNALMRRIKGKGCELKDPFTMVDKTEKYPIYDEATHWKLKKPKFKECLTYDALANGFSLWYATSSTDRVIAKCGDRKEVIKDPSKGKQRQYKKFPTRDPTKVDAHSVYPWRCYRKMLKHVNSFQNCIVSPNQCRRAKSYALSEGESSLQDHYGMLRSYAKAIADSNVGSTVKVGVTVNPDEKTYFDRFYVCLKGLKEGWNGKRWKQSNIRAIVTMENKDNWSWFLSLLGDDLDLPTGCGLTLISHQHKGLIEAVKEVMPYAEHRQCACHIYEGFRKQYSGVLWAASKASYPQLFNKIMEKIKKANPKAHEYLSKKDPKSWSRAFFREGANCEAVENGFSECLENGFSECFNAVLVSVRHKPIITILESMRVLVLERMHTMRLIMEKWTGEVCPKIQSILEHTKDQQRFWHVIPGESKFEVRKRLAMTCHNCWQTGHNKKGCKNDPIPKTPKVKGKAGRPKKTIPTENINLVHDEDFPRFVNNSINDFYKAPSNDGVRINLGRNWNKNKRGGKSGGTCFVKMRGGKSSRGRLVPTERLGRIERWLGADAATSDPIDPRENTLGVKLTRGKHSRSAFIGSTSSSPRVTRQTMNEPPPPQPQVRRRQQAHMPPREKSQRILLRKVSQKITGPE
ncbi:pentatricopeptide repeat-containing protein [Tanacetum coccineum]